MSELNNRERELVALGAAIASNCIPCVEYRVPAARKAGLSDAQIEEALRLADRVRRVPSRLVFESAMARVGVPVSTSANCGCDSPQEAPEAGAGGCSCA